MRPDLSPERWRRISALADEALDLPLEERPQYLDRACSGDPELRGEVETLLLADREAGAFLGEAAGERAGMLLRELLEMEETESTSMIGQDVGNWRLVRRLGQGGMGVVYLAERIGGEFRQNVALKLIKHGMDTKEVIARFEAERQALGLMDHPTIAKIYDAGTTPDGRPYFTMEYVEGIPITEHCDRHELTTRERLDLFVQVCEGVQHAHQKAVIHRDLKPSNVLVGVQDGRPAVKIIDFGIAKALAGRPAGRTIFTELGMMIGTPEYMSPEQAGMSGRDVDTRSDVYSLGVLLYELLVGALPFERRELREAGFDEILRRIREEDPLRPSARLTTLGARSTESARRRRSDPKSLHRQIQGDLDWITMRALEKSPARRYGSPSDLAEDIRRHMKLEPVLAHAPSAAYRARKFVLRHRLGVAAATVMAAGLAAGAVVATVGLVRARRAEEHALLEAQAKGQVAEFLEGLFKVSNPGEARGNSITARELLDKATGTIDKRLSGQPEIQADMAAIMGRVYLNLGLYLPAESLTRKAVEIRKRRLGPEHPETLDSMSMLGWICLEGGRYADAERLLAETLATERRALGPEHSKTRESMSRLASVYLRQRRYAESEKLDLEALELSKRQLGPDHLETVRIKLNLAEDYHDQKRYVEAERYQSEGLESFRRQLGPEHPETLSAMLNLASTYQTSGRLPEAERLFLDTIAIQKRVLGPAHPGTLLAMGNLANVYLDEGRYPDAERLQLESLEVEKQMLGPRHPQTFWTMYNLACTSTLLGDHAKAMDWLRQAIDNGYFNANGMSRDSDLNPLHGPEFDALVDRARRNTAASRAPEGNSPKN
jgi:eukaryotic-like serine/threonine-protein kinase